MVSNGGGVIRLDLTEHQAWELLLSMLHCVSARWKIRARSKVMELAAYRGEPGEL